MLSSNNSQEQFAKLIKSNQVTLSDLLRYEDLLNEPIIEIESIYHTKLLVTPLYYACCKDNTTLVEKLLSCRRININAFSIIIDRGKTRKLTALAIACINCNVKCIELLLNSKQDTTLDVNLGILSEHKYKAISFTTPLLKLCKKFKKDRMNNKKRHETDQYLKPITECVKLLLKHPNIDVNRGNSKIESPLLIAIQTHKYDLIKLLIEEKNIKIPISYLNEFYYWQNHYFFIETIFPILPYSIIISNEFINTFKKNLKVDPLQLYLKKHSKICNLKNINRNNILSETSSNNDVDNQLFLDLLLEKIAPNYFKQIKSGIFNNNIVEKVTKYLLYNSQTSIIQFNDINECLDILFLIYETELWNVIGKHSKNYLHSQFSNIIIEENERILHINSIITEYSNNSNRNTTFSISNILDNDNFYENIYSYILLHFYNQSNTYPDIVIEFENGKKLQCHKNILCASVPFFQGYFSNNNWQNEKLPNEVELIIYSCYNNPTTTRVNSFGSEELIKSMKKAHEYCCDDLATFIGNFVIIDYDNFWNILEMVKDEYLELDCFKYVLKYLALIACIYKKEILNENNRKNIPSILEKEIVTCFYNDFNL